MKSNKIVSFVLLTAYTANFGWRAFRYSRQAKPKAPNKRARPTWFWTISKPFNRIKSCALSEGFTHTKTWAIAKSFRRFKFWSLTIYSSHTGSWSHTKFLTCTKFWTLTKSFTHTNSWTTTKSSMLNRHTRWINYDFLFWKLNCEFQFKNSNPKI